MSTPSHLTAMRHGSYSKPAPPMRKNASASSHLDVATSSHLDSSFPPPPPPMTTGNGNEGELTGSNSTTPRGSMENLPPPPPHLLHSDEDEPLQFRDASPQVVCTTHSGIFFRICAIDDCRLVSKMLIY